MSLPKTSISLKWGLDSSWRPDVVSFLLAAGSYAAGRRHKVAAPILGRLMQEQVASHTLTRVWIRA